MLINSVKIKACNPGTNIKKVGHLDVDHVVWDSTQDQQKIIDSFGSQCNIENIIARMTVGDPLALIGSRGEGSYIDKDTAELLQKDPVELNKLSTEKYMNLYNTFGAKDKVDYDTFVSLVFKGKFEALDKLLTSDKKSEDKKEVIEDA